MKETKPSTFKFKMVKDPYREADLNMIKVCAGMLYNLRQYVLEQVRIQGVPQSGAAFIYTIEDGVEYYTGFSFNAMYNRNGKRGYMSKSWVHHSLKELEASCKVRVGFDNQYGTAENFKMRYGAPLLSVEIADDHYLYLKVDDGPYYLRMAVASKSAPILARKTKLTRLGKPRFKTIGTIRIS